MAILVDAEFSYRLESAEWLPALDWIDQLAREEPGTGAERQMVAGGWMLYAGPQSPANHIIGMGLRGPVSREEFDSVEEFYRRHASVCEVVVSPYADLSLAGHLGERGYRITEWNSVMVRRLVSGERFDTGGIEVRRVEPAGVRAWAEVLGRAWDTPGVSADLFMPLARVANASCFLAYVDGRPAGGAGGSVFPREGLAPLYGAATLAEFRGRGVQNALFQARLQAALRAGCEWAVVCTQPGSVSQRNAERNGFRVAYTKIAMQRQV